MNRIGFILVGALLALILAASTLFVVDQRQFAVVYALGEIKEVISEPGLKVKMPAPLQNVVFLDAASRPWTARSRAPSSRLKRRAW
jgi:membrane protease subunit HflC